MNAFGRQRVNGGPALRKGKRWCNVLTANFVNSGSVRVCVCGVVGVPWGGVCVWGPKRKNSANNGQCVVCVA